MTHRKTIGQQATEKAEEYFKTYMQLKQHENKEISAKAESMAQHDISVQNLINEFALEQLKELIKKDKEIK